MIRLHLVVEGQTEETFVRDVLAPHLLRRRIFCDARCVETGRRRGKVFKGGSATYGKVKRDLGMWMREDQNADAYFSTMIDLYELPDDFPFQHDNPDETPVWTVVTELEEAFRRDMAHPTDHFVPYLQVHEFEALLFADVNQFRSSFPGSQQAIASLQQIRADYASPEHIDENNPPSKRILSVLADYRKRLDGPAIARRIGLDTIRQHCSHFNEWVTKLESLPTHQEQ